MTHTLFEAKTLCAKLLTYWNSLPKGPNNIPNRVDINPNDIREILEHIFLAEKTEKDMTFRVTGGVIGNLQGTTVLRGTPLSSLFDTQSAFLLRSTLKQIWEQPAYAELQLSNRHHTGMGLILPIHSDAGQMDRAIGLIRISGQAPLKLEKTTLYNVNSPKNGELTPLIPADITARSVPTKHAHLRVIKE